MKTLNRFLFISWSLLFLGGCVLQDNPVVEEPQIIAFPNPFQDNINVYLEFTDSAQVAVELIGDDERQNFLFEGWVFADPPTDSLLVARFDNTTLSFDVSDVARGNYILVVSSSANATMNRLPLSKQ